MDPIQQLYEEHLNILRGIGLLDKTIKMVQDNTKIDDEIKSLISFFRNYADTGHHAKEEDVLFKLLIENNPGLGGEFSPLGSLSADHIEGRRLIGNIIKIDGNYGDYSLAYADMIRRHIEIEDELFPTIIEDNLDDAQISTMETLFQEADDRNKIYDHLRILDRLEMQLS